ncbi:hypothetical protein SNOG_07024 [Parastagonospora nodorum SN15]|uniref:Uncharacterized protein n=1 Tax=Phaeosphaeria nodorum (strain SN15 / ATCC MYA-4574 / FGSC 10173) TaxID=321614 RepID=Q0UMJ0_PHANO|nr:hypothetical protein SNOG_07024 [Parastagonospora nodorum SN15]EAT85675.1 hypothetical protein SNOG_07024 [Parastagonospora nodorum SN15]
MANHMRTSRCFNDSELQRHEVKQWGGRCAKYTSCEATGITYGFLITVPFMIYMTKGER